MLTKLKHFASLSASVTKSYVVPAILSVGRVFTNAGRASFYIPNLIQYITNDANHPSSLPVAIFSISCSAIIQIVTRVPPIFDQFQSKKQNKITAKKTEKTCHTCITCCGCDSQLNVKGLIIYNIFSHFSFLYGITNILDNYLGAYSLIEFIAQHGFNYDVHDEEWKEELLVSVSLLIAIFNFISFLSYSYKKADTNAKEFAAAISSGHIPRNRYVLITFIISLFGTFCAPFLSYFSAMRAFDKMKYMKLTDTPKIFIGLLSAINNFVFQLTTNIPAVYKTMTRQHHNDNPTPTCEKISKGPLYAAGVGEAANTAVNNFLGFVNTANEISGIDKKSLKLIVPGIICASSTGMLNFFFNTVGGTRDFYQRYYHDIENTNDYSPLPQDDIENGSNNENQIADFEAGNDINDTQPIEIRNSFVPTLFKNPISFSLGTRSVPQAEPMRLVINSV